MNKRVFSQQLCAIGRSRMDVFKSRYFNVFRLQLLCIGMWPDQPKFAALPIRIYITISGAVFINGEVRKTLDSIQYDWHTAELNNEDHILKANAEKGWRFSKSFMITLTVHTSAIVTLQFIPEYLNLSISNNITRFVMHARGEFYLDPDKYDSLILYCLTITFIGAVFVSSTVALQWFVILNHACGMFAIFGYRLEHVFHVSSRKHDREDSVKKILVHTVEYHKRIIKYTDSVNYMYSTSMVPLMMIGAIIVSTFAVQLHIAITGSRSFLEAFPVTAYCAICIWYMFINFVPAQGLIDTSSNVFRQVYYGEWYNASISDQKTLLFIMKNCMEPITISKPTILTVSMEYLGMLLCIGMWPYQNKLAAIPMRICVVVMGAVFINGEIQRAIKSRHQIQLFLEPIPYLLTACGILIKYIVTWIRADIVRKTLNSIQYDWHTAELNNEDHILKANAEKGWRFSKSFMLTAYTYMFAIFSLQFVPEYLKLSISNNITPFVLHVRGELFLDQVKYYELILLYLTGIFMSAVIMVVALTLQWFVIINHACGMFAIFGYRLEHVFHVSSRKRDREDNVKKILVHTVEYHKKIMKYAATVNYIYSHIMFPLLMVGAIILSTFFIQVYIVVTSSTRFLEVFPITAYGAICTYYLFIITVPAQKLIDASSKVFRQIYFGEWYNASISDQKTLLLIMQNCMEPTTIRSANIITISMAKFGMVVRFSMSCFTLLCSLS